MRRKYGILTEGMCGYLLVLTLVWTWQLEELLTFLSRGIPATPHRPDQQAKFSMTGRFLHPPSGRGDAISLVDTSIVYLH